MNKGSESPWKMWRDTYGQLVSDIVGSRNHQRFEYSPERIENVISLIVNKDAANVYPAKSRLMAIVYALLIEQVYGEEFYETLNNPSLLDSDIFFAPYLEDMETYDVLLTRLKAIPNWMSMGTVSDIIKQFYLECTPQGVESLRSNSMSNKEVL